MEHCRVKCPACGAILAVPAGQGGGVARCGCCKSRFRLPPEAQVTEEAVLHWLQEKEQEEERAEAAGEAHAATARQKDLAPDVPVSGNTAVLPALGGEFRLVRVDEKGALFEFPAARLLDPAFRSAMPRRCLNCGARVRLHTHVIIFTPQFRDSLSLEAEHSVGELIIREQDLHRLAGHALLQRLPRVPNVPHPGDLPMPYWLCEMCTTAPAVAGQIQVNPQTGEGWCRLRIKALRRAEEFLQAVCGQHSPDQATLREYIEATLEDPWQALPKVVQHRLAQWFNPQEGERFIAYIPDRDYFRSEDGMAGLLISNGRLIYHTERRHGEVPTSEPMELKLALAGGKTFLQLNAPSCQIRRFCLDGEGVRKLHRAFASGKFKVSWR